MKSSISAVTFKESMGVVMIGITGGVGDAQISHRHTLHSTTMIVGMLQKNSNPTNRNKNSTVKKSVKN